jgi:hypothetical protein
MFEASSLRNVKLLIVSVRELGRKDDQGWLLWSWTRGRSNLEARCIGKHPCMHLAENSKVVRRD